MEDIHISFQIRRAAEADVTALVEFNQAMALETESKRLDGNTLQSGVIGLLRQPQFGFYLVAESVERDIIGALLVTYEWSDWRNGLFWWIQSVYVLPSWRGRGVYRKLYEQVKSMAAGENVCGFRLYVERENEAAQNVYKRLGMTETYYLMFEELTERDKGIQAIER